MKLGLDAVRACVEVGSEETLSLAHREFVAGLNMQPACVARADAGHKNGPGVARSPSWRNLGRIAWGKGRYVATLNGVRGCRRERT